MALMGSHGKNNKFFVNFGPLAWLVSFSFPVPDTVTRYQKSKNLTLWMSEKIKKQPQSLQSGLNWQILIKFSLGLAKDLAYLSRSTGLQAI